MHIILCKCTSPWINVTHIININRKEWTNEGLKTQLYSNLALHSVSRSEPIASLLERSEPRLSFVGTIGFQF